MSFRTNENRLFHVGLVTLCSVAVEYFYLDTAAAVCQCTGTVILCECNVSSVSHGFLAISSLLTMASALCVTVN